MDWENFYSRFREPDFVPGYEIQNRLGGGAFGEVYKARKHSIGKAYAIKFLKLDDEAQREAVERELEAVRHFAVIDHPNLVSIEDLGTVMGVPYLIMGYAGEDTLARRLKQGPLEPHEALSYFVQTCRGVWALHERRLVHFDLKLSNVFLRGDVARVGDYGLSKMMADGHSTLSFGRGTPHYMAPEMLRNRADHRADVYSLGVILFESFARRLPYPSAVPGTIALREDDAPPLFPPEFPAALRPVVERCLRLAPADRYVDVAELLAEMGQTARPGDPVRDLRAESTRAAAVERTPARGRGAATQEAAGARRETPRGDPRRAGEGAVRPPGAAGAGAHAGAAGAGAHAGAAGAGAHAGAAGAGAHAGAEAAGAHAGAVPPGGGSSSTTSSDARQAARELTRGAVEVARGMWDGVVTGPVQRARGEAAPTSVAEGAGRDVLTLHTLSGETGALEPWTEAGTHAAATIPVPPPVQGGWFGTCFSSVALGLEVLFAIARAVLGAAWRWIVGRPAGRPRSWTGRIGLAAGRVARFTLFAIGSCVAGLLAAASFLKLWAGAD